MSKKLTPSNVGSMDLTQSRLKSKLHDDIRAYRKYRELKTMGFRCVAKIRMSDLQRRQVEINQMRKPLGLRPIRAIQELKKYLKQLK